MVGSQDMATAEPNEAAYATSLSQLPCSVILKAVILNAVCIRVCIC